MIKKIPTVSVIVPVHNQEKYIGRCLRSLLNQTISRDDYEIIVINDGSIDKTEFALQLFQDEIKIISLKENLGLPSALNVGIGKAKGRFVVRVDADDYVHQEYLNLLSIHLSMNDYMDAVACDYQLVDDAEHILKSIDCMKEPIGCGIMFRIEHLIDLGLYDEDMKCHEDKDLRLRFLDKYNIHRVMLPLYRYRRHESNMTNDVDNMDSYLEKLKYKHQSASGI